MPLRISLGRPVHSVPHLAELPFISSLLVERRPLQQSPFTKDTNYSGTSFISESGITSRKPLSPMPDAADFLYRISLVTYAQTASLFEPRHSGAVATQENAASANHRTTNRFGDAQATWIPDSCVLPENR